MKTSRRSFLQGFSLSVAGVPVSNFIRKSKDLPVNTDEAFGMLYDATRCIGCRSCEAACNEVNALPKPAVPFDDESVLQKTRKTGISAYTVVNRYPQPERDPVNRKEQCMHCNNAACVSACLVDALNKTPEGAVVWDRWKCIGCRYCMLSCPFQMLKFEFLNALNPRMQKCNFCHDRISKGGVPGCFEACPADAIAFGKRKDMLAEARRRIKDNPGQYIDHIYGEKEIGGTAKLYLAGVPFERLRLEKLKEKPVPELTESIQHGVFKYFLPPLGLFAVLGGLMAFFKPKEGG